MPAKPITEEQTEKVKNLRGKMTAQQIAGEVGVTIHQVHDVYRRHNMTTKQNPTFELNMLQKQLIYGGILGDGRLKRNGKYNYYYSECHAMQEKEYCEWKHRAFGNLTNGTNMYGKNLNNEYVDAIEFCTRTTPTLIEYANLSKDEVIERINEVGLIIFLLDDGWFNKSGKTGHFCVAGGVFSEEQLQKLCDKFNEYGFTTAHVVGRKSRDISFLSSSNKYIYYLATKLVPESTDIIQKKFKYMYETGQVADFSKMYA